MAHEAFRLPRSLWAALAFAAPACANAATDLGGVVVTATRTAQTQDQALAAVTVLDRADIERLQPASLPDLLRGTPGMSLANNGGPGKLTTAFLRGTESDQVLVLVDGVKLGAATSGTAALQDIPIEQIERVEIVRGPFSSLYGSEALGGVIQIFTRHPQGAFTPTLSLGLGSYGRYTASAGLAGQGAKGWYAIQASHDQTDGINACRVGAAEAGAACFADQPDRDDYRNNALSLQGGYRFDEAWDGDLRLFRAEGRNDYDGSFSDSDNSASQVLGGRLRYRPGKDLGFTLSLGSSGDFNQDFLHGVHVDHFDTHRLVGSLQADLGLWGGLLSAGYDWQRDKVDSSIDFVLDRRTDRGLFAQWQQSFGKQSVQASLRHDDNSQFGGKTTGSLLWGWDLGKALRLTASYGTAFKAPTFNELYYPGYGNPQLAPENAQNIELGLRGSHGWGHWSLNVFRNNIEDLISYDATTGLPANVERARIRGAEGVLGTRLAGWSLQATATWLDPDNDSAGPDRGKLLPRRARRSARLDLDRSFGAFSAGMSEYLAGRRYDDLDNRHPLGGYALTDLRLAYALDREWKLQLALDNVFDRRYETAWFYNQPGRNYMLTLRYQPAH